MFSRVADDAQCSVSRFFALAPLLKNSREVMRNESISLLLAFFCLALIPVMIYWVIACVGHFFRKKDWPSIKDAIQQHAIEVAITIAITLVICLVFKWTGFFLSNCFGISFQHD